MGPQASDQGQLVGMLDEINETFGVEPAVVLADAGYCNEPDLLELEDRGIDAHVALGREGKSQVAVDPARLPATHRHVVTGVLLGLLCSVTLMLFLMRPEEVESQAALWLAFAGFPTWGEAFTTTTDDWIRAGLWALLIVCIIFLSVGLIRMFCSSRGGAAKTTEPPELPKHDETVVPEELAEPGEDDFRSFDVEIRDAVNHLVETSAHTFNSSGGAERQAFRALHKEMCADKLSIIGMQGDFNAPERISARECRELKPREVVVPPNPTSHNGVLFALIDEKSITATPVNCD